jgi:uncharacterized lipoprotein YddW (UPF0748 family)
MNHRTVIALAAWLVLCSVDFAPAQVPPKREFRGVWIATVLNLDWPSAPGLNADAQRAQLTALLDQLRAAGATAVIFQVRPECDALYVSSLEPWSQVLTGIQGASPGYDPLDVAVQETHRRGMEIHAWFNPYRAIRSVGSYAISSSHVTVTHPEWILTFAASGSSPQLKILNPGVPDVRTHVATVVADIVRRYDVDGVHADDYFYPYPPQAITTQDDSTYLLYNRGIPDRGDWRRDNVNLLMQQITDSIAAVKPYVKFGMSPFGIWKNGVPPGIAGLDAYNVIYGDAMAWLHQHTVDYLTPQLYWRIGGSQDYSKLMPWWADSTAAYGRHLYTGHIFGSYTAAELPNQVKLNRLNLKVGGSVFFRAQNFPQNTLTFADSLKQNYYHYPALLPTMAWKDVVAPYMPRGIRYAPPAPGATAALLWDLPMTAPDGDSASRYVVYRFDHHPSGADLDDPRNILSIEGTRSYVPPPPPAGTSPYYYLVTALDRNYNESDTSGILILGPPPAPVLAFPLNDAADRPESVSVFWNAHPLASAYHVQVSTDSGFSTNLLVDAAGITDTSYVIRGLEGQSKYYWKVRANGAGGTGPFAPPFAFTTGFPATPALATPPNLSTDVPVSLTLAWRPAQSPQPVTYRIQCARNADFSTLVLDSSGVADTTMALNNLQSFTIYFWRVSGTNAVGTSGWSSVFRFRTMQVSGVGEEDVPATYALEQNYPNPFNPATTIPFQVPAAVRVTIVLYDILGREVDTLVDEVKPPGRYEVTWSAAARSSGVYFVRITAGGFTSVKRLMLVK